MTFDQIPLDAQFVCRGTGHRCVRVSRTERDHVSRRAEAFGVFDAKGREIGHSYSIDREFWVVDGASNSLRSLDKLDVFLEETFIVYPHGLRDGRHFGALPVASYKRFRTLAEAEAYGEATIASARKRAAKKAA